LANRFDWSRLSPLSIAAGVGGAVLGAYANFNLIIPGLVSGGLWFALINMAPSAKRPVLPAIAWQGGQLGWFLVGVAAMPAAISQVWLDVLILGGLLIWFYVSQSKVAAWSLVAYQAISVLINAWMFTQSSVDSNADRALAVHIGWRVVGIVLLVRFVRRQVTPDPAVTAKTFE
jgi:hypothetical protein